MIDLVTGWQPGRRGATQRSREPHWGLPDAYDTTELRWFARGSLPVDVRTWVAASPAATEQRCDRYLLDQDVDVGIKARGGRTLELKVRREVGQRVYLGPDLHGTVEEWRKWSPADRMVDLPRYGRWVSVTKTVTRRRFSVAGKELTTSVASVRAGCDVEITQVAVGPVEACTLAFAAFGPRATRRAALQASWQTMTACGRVPQSLVHGWECSMGYPEWLTGMHASAHVSTGSLR